MESYHLFTWGANSHGQLCLGYKSEQQIIPEEIDMTKANISPSSIVKIVGGGGHTLILTQNGDVFACGLNRKGQCSSPVLGILNNLQPVDGLKTERIKDIASGWDSSIALTENGEVYTWGSNIYGQLGRKTTLQYSTEPRKIQLNKNIKRIAMGLRHTALVTEDGKIMVTGAGNKGQLGIFNENLLPLRQTHIFHTVPGLTDIDDVSCGQYFTAAVKKSGEIYLWGSNKYGQLAADSNNMQEVILPSKINTNFGSIDRLHCGWTHAGVLGQDGRIFSWGRNSYGQLGSRIVESAWVPRILNDLPRIKQFCVGSEHNVALDVDGNVLTWGWNEHGNCGNGATDNVWYPEKISIPEDYTGLLIGSGAGHAFALMKKINQKIK